MVKPKFERVKNHKFEKDEKIYVIDENGYDIYEAIIKDINENNYSIHYPDYPQDDKIFDNIKNFLVITPKNEKIFKKQDQIRLEIENQKVEEEEEDVKEKKVVEE